MGSGTRSTEQQDQRALVRHVAIGGGWLLGIALLVRALDGFTSNPTTAAALGAIAVSFAATRLGVKTAPFSSGRKRLVAGLLFGVVPVVAVLASGFVGGTATVTAATPTVALLYGLFEAVAIAYRNEFWLHGIPLLFARRAGVPWPIAVGFAASAGVAFAAGTATSLMSLLVECGLGLLCAGLWWWTKDAWAPAAAHFTWRWCTQSALAGDLIDVTFTSGGCDKGVLSVVALASFVALFVCALRSSNRLSAASTPDVSADRDRGA